MTTELAELTFPALVGERERLMPLDEVARENLGEDDVGSIDWTRIAFPREGVQWRVPDPSEESGFRRVDELVGVIVAQRRSRVFFLQEYDASAEFSEADCRAEDGRHGTPNPKFFNNVQTLEGETWTFGGDCQTCPLNQFESRMAIKGGTGRGKACTEYRHLYLLQPESDWPIDVRLPPTQLQPLREFANQLTQRGVPFKFAVVSLTVGEREDSTYLKPRLLDVLPKQYRRNAADLQTIVFAMTSMRDDNALPLPEEPGQQLLAAPVEHSAPPVEASSRRSRPAMAVPERDVMDDVEEKPSTAGDCDAEFANAGMLLNHFLLAHQMSKEDVLQHAAANTAADLEVVGLKSASENVHALISA